MLARTDGEKDGIKYRAIQDNLFKTLKQEFSTANMQQFKSPQEPGLHILCLDHSIFMSNGPD